MARHPTLSQYDRSGDASPAARQARSSAGRDNREPATREPALGTLGVCWCGQPRDHDWAGKGDGAPHPREDRQR